MPVPHLFSVSNDRRLNTRRLNETKEKRSVTNLSFVEGAEEADPGVVGRQPIDVVLDDADAIAIVFSVCGTKRRTDGGTRT